MFSPRQLAFLCEQLDATSGLPGSIVEIGCAWGATTIHLKRHLADVGPERPYVCIDTFSGFTDTDVAFERDHRGKTFGYDDFRANSVRRFRRTLKMNHVAGVEVVAADATGVDFAAYAPISFGLLDVDLYRPTKAVLGAIAPLMAPGGVLVVDDCIPDPPDDRFDGAAQAFEEFRHDAGVAGSALELTKLGVLRF